MCASSRQLLWISTLVALLAAPGRLPAADEVPSVIRVTGEGKAAAPPDMATINAGVTSEAPTAREALDANNEAMRRLLEFVTDRGIAAKDVQTSNFSLSPVYEHDQPQRSEPKVRAYRVQNSVEVRVRNLDALGELLDGLVSSGSNQIHGVGFDVANPQRLLDKARRDAIRNAKARAKVFAEAAGVEVGSVIQISEQTAEPPRPMQMGMEMRAMAADVPIATGEQEFNVRVNVTYKLKPAP